MTLMLASGSPRRHQLLRRLGFDFVVQPSTAPERAQEPGEYAVSYALALARAKALEVAYDHTEAVVLAADTIVVLDHVALGKPKDDGDAQRMLESLRARDHTVVTAVVVRTADQERSDTVATMVRMKGCNRETLQQYVRTGEPADKAGAYAIQGAGNALVAGIKGCYFNVVGLPLCTTLQLLSWCDIVHPTGGNPCLHLEFGDRLPDSI